MRLKKSPGIAFIGLGEAASAIISGWKLGNVERIKAYDIKFEQKLLRPELVSRAASLGIELADSREAALAGSDFVFSTVTSSQAVRAATECFSNIDPGAHWFDLNSCAPSSKREAASIINTANANYHDVAVMAPVYPKLNLVPMLISGPKCSDLLPHLRDLPLSIRDVGTSVGHASSIKLVRSIMVKGLEALTSECIIAAVAAGVEDEVISSLKSGHPNIDLHTRAYYNFERSITHGIRRSEEMEEAARMLDEMGLPNSMSLATAEWQKTIGELDDENAEFGDIKSLAERLTKLIRESNIV